MVSGLWSMVYGLCSLNFGLWSPVFGTEASETDTQSQQASGLRGCVGYGRGGRASHAGGVRGCFASRTATSHRPSVSRRERHILLAFRSPRRDESVGGASQPHTALPAVACVGLLKYRAFGTLMCDVRCATCDVRSWVRG